MEETKQGIVVASDGGLYEIYLETKERISCKPRGRFRHKSMRLLVGDRVTVAFDEQGNAVVDRILERNTVLIRPPVANLDVIFVVVSASSPDPIYENVDKLTAIAEHNRITPVILITKADLDRQKAEEISAIYQSAGYQVFDAGVFEAEGKEALKKAIGEKFSGKISAFAGASGVGKSTLMNGLFSGLDLKTGQISEKIGRGKHTTRSVTLFPLSELVSSELAGFLADTPGFSMLDFENFNFFSLSDLPHNFPEFEEQLGCCKYTKCTHRKEDGCAVLALVKEGKIAKSRHDSYCSLYELLKNKHEWD
jgi:ribosome biogenesis GTPase